MTAIPGPVTPVTPGPAGPPGPGPASGSALEKTLRVLEVLAAPGGPHRLADVAAACRVPKSSTYRVLVSLVGQGYAVTDGEGRYGIGLRLRLLAAGVGAEHGEGIVELLEFLHKCTGHTVHLALRDGPALICVRKTDGGRPFRTASRVGTRLPLHATAVGKAVLAHLPPSEAEEAVRTAGLPALTARTLTDRERLGAELAGIRERGHAVDEEECEVSVRCVGVPVFDRAGSAVGGISLTATTVHTVRGELERFTPALTQAARGVERLLQLG
ncbi:IclR family transcriptional regulator [Streptomyces sp. NBC_00249]|uniref:IclR family transcriptional regulator n=1 Tax=Streptomyces sp. NBC_00249 TaxID=2975690 RepID=UPI002259E64A|nr:IclR family transcriptional regulator [Streptomyces sp. NBC_00249]MCX5198547.1 IclR family transcriptional regulator [Streptomyces sp. NBC_00249]